MEKVIERFLRYVSFDTQSDENSLECPSSRKQLIFAQELSLELKNIGINKCEVDNYGYVYATLPANTNLMTPVIGFISHLDISPDLSGKNVKPQIIRNYQGGDILLNEEIPLYLKEFEFPEIRKYRGQNIITTDGNTLLGADDKAGIAEIMTAIEFLITHPEIPHGQICIAFTPDEEIGRGADKFDVKKFGADFAFTVDGGELGELETENFNAATATIIVKGKSVHTGTAKNKMVNSLLLAQELINMFPKNDIPAKTEGYEGFYHLMDVKGTVENTELRYLIRDHNRNKFELRKEFIKISVENLNNKYGKYISLDIKDSYYNMKEVIEKYPHVSKLAFCAMKELGIEPIVTPIRGGTDGARLSFMGLPTPNIFTGGHNFHGRYEFIPESSMIKAVQVIIKICELATSL
ncbi:MAG: peptidase T [Clostridia bacterium]|nr:peptidase T [Clostridia bacterium]MDD4047670.1 peptidase T [Clostridia bacterium]